MFVARVVPWRTIDHDVFVRRNSKPDVDLEAGAMAVLVARRDHGYAAPNDVAIMRLQPLYFMFDRNAHGIRWLGSFESHLQWSLHNGWCPNSLTTIRPQFSRRI